MQTTLSERLKDAMLGPPKVTGRQLAAACGISPPSVSDWLTGATKTIDAGNLIYAAEFLRVNPKWLALGIGIKHLVASNPDPKVEQTNRGYFDSRTVDAWTLEAVSIFEKLQPHQREGALAVLRAHVTHLGPPIVGQTVQMAG